MDTNMSIEGNLRVRIRKQSTHIKHTDNLFAPLVPHCLWSNSEKCFERFAKITR